MFFFLLVERYCIWWVWQHSLEVTDEIRFLPIMSC